MQAGFDLRSKEARGADDTPEMDERKCLLAKRRRLQLEGSRGVPPSSVGELLVIGSSRGT